jgi:FkbM family methyltransferase
MKALNGKIVRTSIESQEIFFFVNDEHDLIQRSHAQGSFYEIEELMIIKQYFTGGCFIDIGANIGNHVIYVGKYLNPSRVVCVEPNPAALDILFINLRLNGLSDIVDQRYLGIGLGAAAGTAALLNPQNNNMGAMRLVTGEGDVRVAVGDDLLHTEDPSFLKIDVEGMEIDVLRGLERLITKCRPTMFIEIDNKNRQVFDEWRESHGYEIAATYRRYPTNENFLLLHR